MTAPVVLAAHVGFDDVADALESWDGPVDTVDGLDGPPILARWTRGEAEVRYSSHPDLGLVILEGSGVDLLPPLTRMRVGTAAADARSGDLATALRGATVLGLLGDPAALPALDALRADPTTPPAVLGAADLAVTRLGELAILAGADRLAQLRAHYPERTPVLGLLGDPVTRRQAIRSLRAQPSGGPQHHRSAVLAGLADDDWEVRWSALLAAHDLAVDDVLLEVRRCEAGPGPDSRQRQVLEAVRDVVGRRLSRRRPSAEDGPAAVWLDDPLHAPDGDADAALLVTSLRSPLLDPVEASDAPPVGYAIVDRQWHWLGGEGLPVRRLRPQAAYAVAAQPTGEVAADSLDAALRSASRAAGAALRLPTPDELEMAVRGPDGRRYPWGSGRERGWRRALSPWDVEGPWDVATWAVQDEQPVVVAPAVRGLGAPAQRVVDEQVTALLRPVLDL
jgi:hypothetical protein